MKRKMIQTTVALFIASSVYLLFFYSGSHAQMSLKKVAAACDISAGGAITSTVFVPWYKYLGDNTSGKCEVKLPEKPQADCGKVDKDGKPVPCTDLAKTATLVSIAIIELLTGVSALVAVGFIIFGSFQYITSQGEPEGIRNAKSTITNALIGFIIVVLAIAIVQFLGKAIR